MQSVYEPMASPLQISLLGPFDVRVENKPLAPLRTRKGQWLFALLALRHGRVVAREWLAGTLWPDSAENQALANLRLSLTDLRHALGGEAYRLGSPTTQTLCLDLEGAEVDLLAFDKAVQSDDPSLWEQGVDTYRGMLLEGCNEEWVFPERRAHEQAFLCLLERLSAWERSAGKPMAAVRHLRRALAVDPFAESVHCSLMQALADTGDFASATQHYRDLRQLLHRELNAEPSAATSALFKHIQRQAHSQVHSPGLSTEPGLPSAAVGCLPRPVSRFIGRENAVNTIKGYLQDVRLLTLTGMGGVGKTRLAIQVAHEVAAAFPDGVWFVDLSSLSDPGVVPQSIATVLGVREQPDRTLLTSLGDYLQRKHLLLILDNCEHLLAASAAAIDTLLQRCAFLHFLTTSRQPLGLTGEATWQVPSLALPEASSASADPKDLVSTMVKYEAVQLFVERATLALPTFQLNPQNVRAVAEVCAHVDGIPLALELAAARVRALSMEQIAVRLEDRFHLLTGGSRTALPRQQTLRASIDWSYNLLLTTEQRLLRRLAVFSGGWTLEGAEEVCAGESVEIGEVVDLVTQLVDKSLVAATEEAGVMRYRLLETVRHYAFDRLVESEETEEARNRHRIYFLALAEEAGGKLQGSEHHYWANRLETEYDNLRAVLRGCLETVAGRMCALQLAGALSWFWDRQGYLNEGRAFLQAALAHPDAPEQIANANYAGARAGALYGAGKLAWRQNDVESAAAYFEESLRLYEVFGDPTYRAFTLLWLGNAVFRQQRYRKAQDIFAQTLALGQELKNDALMAWAFLWLGNVADEPESAHTYYLQSLSLAKQIGLNDCLAHCLCNLGSQAMQRGDYAAARTLFRDGLQHWRILQNKPETVQAVAMLALLAAASGQERRATLLFAATENLRKEMGIAVAANKQQEYTERVSAMQTVLTEETFSVIWAQGQAMSFDQTVETALQDT
jgi:predicted ATPase/DNA-binding SARP family transcriptional activator